MQATAIAHANIALVKYWGKRDKQYNLPAVGSISITLKNLFTKTRVVFDAGFGQDRFLLNGGVADKSQTARVSRFLDLVRRPDEKKLWALVESENNFPTGAGLASSASGFAALSLAASEALGMELSPRELSVLARQGSGSAARSVFGGFVEMKKGENPDGSDSYAVQLATENYWNLAVLIAITSEERKKTGSTRGMILSQETSPYYNSWVQSSQQDLDLCREAIIRKDFSLLAQVSEFSCLKMHALAMSSQPGIVYWNGITVDVLHTIRQLRQQGVPVFFTIDAGPQVKAICEPGAVDQVRDTILGIDGIRKVILSPPGPDAKIVEE